jgi:hypothetical protein
VFQGITSSGELARHATFSTTRALSEFLIQRPVAIVELNPHLETPWFMGQGPHPYDYPRMASLPAVPWLYIRKFQVIPRGQGGQALYLGAGGAEIKQEGFRHRLAIEGFYLPLHRIAHAFAGYFGRHFFVRGITE